jgi:hypothetical protein
VLTFPIDAQVSFLAGSVPEPAVDLHHRAHAFGFPGHVVTKSRREGRLVGLFARRDGAQ